MYRNIVYIYYCAWCLLVTCFDNWYKMDRCRIFSTFRNIITMFLILFYWKILNRIFSISTLVKVKAKKCILFWKNRPSSIEIRIFLYCEPRNRGACHVTTPIDTYSGSYEHARTTRSVFGFSFKRNGQIRGERSASRVHRVQKRHYVRLLVEFPWLHL